MFEMILLGLIQGVAEWLPVSSEGLLVVAQNMLGETTLVDAISLALFLHLGTWLAAVVYFWDAVVLLVRDTISYKGQARARKQEINFYVMATLASGVVALALFYGIARAEDVFAFSGRIINLLVASMLFVTAWLQLRQRAHLPAHPQEPTGREGVYAGLAQGLAIIPGVSRSGITTSVLFIRGFDQESALVFSFLMSIPLVLAGNIVLNFGSLVITGPLLVACGVSFVVGLLTIHMLLALARRVNLGWLALVFAVLLLVGTVAFF